MKKFKASFRENSLVEKLSLMGKKHVALVYGGMSSEREVSIMSSKSIEKSLLENGYQVTKIDMGADISNILQDIKPDLVFNCLHGTFGEDGCLQGLLNILQIPFTHSGMLSSAIAFNKKRTKEIFLNNGIKCTEGIIVKKSDNIKDDPIKRPYVIKPLCEGSSIGIEIIFDEDQFSFANYQFEYGNEVFVEKYIKGRELQVAVLNGKALGVLEIKLLKNRFYDYETKYTEGLAEHILPAQIPEDVYEKAMRVSENCYDVLGCKGLVRVEFIYSEEENEIYVLELNTHPGFTSLSICPEIAAYAGISFNDLIEKVIENASLDFSIL